MFSQLEKCIRSEDFDVTLDEGVEVIPYMVSSCTLFIKAGTYLGSIFNALFRYTRASYYYKLA